jgi:hypothetical protein
MTRVSARVPGVDSESLAAMSLSPNQRVNRAALGRDPRGTRPVIEGVVVCSPVGVALKCTDQGDDDGSRRALQAGHDRKCDWPLRTR